MPSSTVPVIVEIESGNNCIARIELDCWRVEYVDVADEAIKRWPARLIVQGRIVEVSDLTR